MGLFSWLWGSIPDDEDEDEDGLGVVFDLQGNPLLDWVRSFFPGKSVVEKLQESERRCSDLLSTLSVDLSPPVVKDESDKEDDDDCDDKLTDATDELPASGCILRKGRITALLQEGGLIDEHIHFEISSAPENLCVNDEVTYLAYRSDNLADWKVRNILTTGEQVWEGETDYEDSSTLNEADVAIELETMYRSELRQVTGRKNREVIVNNGEFQFNLDTVTSLFTPVVGDFVFLDAVVVRDEAVADFGGEILEIDRIRWVRYKVVTDRVTHVDAFGNGIVGTNIYFSRDCCAAGYVPCKGDDVSADPIESYQGKCSWRALSITPLKTIKKVIRNNCNAATEEIEMLCESKHGISISGDLDFGQVQKGELGKDVLVKITNEGDVDQTIVHGDFYLARRGSQVFPQKDIGNKVIHPGQSVQYAFGCRGKFMGQSRELFVFCFIDFKIGCNFEVDVNDNDSLDLLMMDNASVGSTKTVSRLSRNVTRYQKRCVIKGVMPIQPPKFIAFRFDLYKIPERFWKALFDETNTLKLLPDIEECLPKMCTVLTENLGFKNYRERFHALLYLEEIDSCLKVEKFSMSTVLLERSGEYLSLDVPGLAEKRPSLLVGDKALATRPWKNDEIIYEGYVHKTCGKSVMLKFSDEFHLKYNYQVVNIRFELGRSAIRRQHGAIDLAMTHLGEAILFPSKIVLKDNQIDLEEYNGLPDDKMLAADKFLLKPESNKRKISWFNTSLNLHQRVAISNVLKGKARPLPYIIFGPPGTGKTMTLVETILQILFLLPDSRMLVATPSNSSANLITERLLDSNLLKPGDLVRLVGYHVIEDGSLPERLRPYSTTGIIKDVRGDEAKGLPIGELKVSSNKNTLGRHRITIGTCIALGQLVCMGFPQGHFTHVVVDEAGQATEPEIMVPLGFLDTTGQAILAGDPRQLGPVVGSSLAVKYGLGESYLDRLIHRFPYERDQIGFPDTGGHDPRLVTRLVDNYRSLPEILALPNSMFYNSDLVPQVSAVVGVEADWLRVLGEYLPVRSDKFDGPSPILFHGVVGKNLQDNDSPSWFNPHETLIAMDYLSMAYSCGLTPADVGIITPYRKQVQKMRWYFDRLKIDLPKIGSVEEFQGQERNMIILSAVRSSPQHLVTDHLHSLGFVASPKRLNVAITRARALLVIIGNPHLLSLDPFWRTTIKYCIERECYTGCDPPLSCVTRYNDKGELEGLGFTA